MKQVLYLFALLSMIAFITSCEGVPAGHSAAYVDWGGATDMTQVYDEGMHTSPWLWLGADLENYDCREQTMTLKGNFLDFDGLDTDVEVILYYAAQPKNVNQLHSKFGPDYETKIKGIFKGAVQTEVAKHQALKLNREERPQAEAALTQELQPELESMFVDFKRIQVTDVDLPQKISDMIEQAKEQDEKNILAEKLKLEKENEGKALEAESIYALKAAKNNAETKRIMSRPETDHLHNILL